MINNFVFYLPSKSIGGFEYFFIRLAKILSKLKYNIYYIDYIDGLSRKELLNDNVKFIDYNDNNFYIKFDEAVNFIVPYTMMSEINNISTPLKSKYLYFVAHPNSYSWLQYRSNYTTDILEKKTYEKKHNICFMDYACAIKFEKFYPIKDYYYIPIFAPEIELFNEDLINNEINIGWLGRLDNDKIWSLINILDNLILYSTNKKKNIHIIGDGNSKNMINLKYYNDNNINIILTGTLLNEEKNNYLSKNVDISFSMGTAAIECSTMKIPTIIPLLSNNNILSSNAFVNFYDSKNYNLGCYIDDINELGIIKSNFNDILNDIYIDNMKKVYGIKCFDYYKNNHTSEISINKLLKYFED